MARGWRRRSSGGRDEPELNAYRAAVPRRQPGGGRARPRRLRLVLAGVAALLAVAVGGVVALDQRAGPRETRAAQAQRLGRRRLSEQPLDRSLLFAREAISLHDLPSARDHLLAALRRAPAALPVMPAAGNPLNAMALHPDGRTLAAGDTWHLVFLDAITGRRPGDRMAASRAVSSLTFSPDGTRLASAGWDATPSFVELLNAGTHATSPARRT